MIACPSVSKRSIQNHYDLATPFYWLLWGSHIHHGLWEEDAPPAVAQYRLIDRLATLATVKHEERVLDVGCGMGGSSIALAKRFGCRVTGVTLSPIQRCWARWSAGWQGLGDQVHFLRRDAEQMKFPAEAFDVVWNIECSEHFFDKPGFFRQAASWLRPGGRIAVCAWLAGEGPEAEAPVQTVGEAFLCPSFGTASDYQSWLETAGLVMRARVDLTQQVVQTWDICRRRVQASGVSWLSWLGGRRIHAFVDHFATLGNAYRSGAMQYGLFVAEKPSR